MKALSCISLIAILFAGCAGDPDANGDATVDGDGSTIDGDGSVVDGDGSVIDPDASTSDAGVPDSTIPLDDAGNPIFDTNDAGQVLCGQEPCQCSNGIDDDGDGKVDGFDEECTGPYDNDEGTFATGIPGDNKDKKQDCFFDGNSGAGNDGCELQEGCTTGDLTGDACDTVNQMCIDYCGARTPNGCDCFGCCEIFIDGSPEYVRLTEECDLMNDGTLSPGCTTCIPNDACANTCGECELCPGRDVADLPDTCFPPDADGGVPDTPVYTCDEGQSVCGESQGCAAGYYCQLGCCVPSLI